MKRDTVEERRISHYLLGKLESQEQQLFEEQLITQDGLFDQLLLIEDELIDEYLNGSLPPEDTERFAKYFLLTPQRSQKVKFAEAFRRFVADKGRRGTLPSPKPSFWNSFVDFLNAQAMPVRYGLQAALLGMVVAGLWLSHTTWRLHNDVVQIRGQQQVFQAEKQELKLELEQQRQRSWQLEQQLTTVEAKNKPNTDQVPQLNQPSLIAFALTPGMLRESGALKKLRIPSSTSLVGLKLDVGRNSYATYRAVLLDDKGSEVWALNRARESRSGALSYVLVILPTTVLEPGDYSLKISGITQGGELEPAGLYYFRVLPN